MSWRRVRIELQRAFQLCLRACQVPVENPPRFTKIAMRLRIFFVERNCLQGCLLGGRISLEWCYINVGQKIPDFGDPSPGSRKCRIFLQRSLKETKRPSQIGFAALVREIKTLQIKIVCFRVPLFMGRG